MQRTITRPMKAIVRWFARRVPEFITIPPVVWFLSIMDVGEQFEIVRNLLARQEEVLQELDALESRVEQILKQFVGSEDSESEGDSASRPIAA